MKSTQITLHRILLPQNFLIYLTFRKPSMLEDFRISKGVSKVHKLTGCMDEVFSLMGEIKYGEKKVELCTVNNLFNYYQS